MTGIAYAKGRDKMQKVPKVLRRVLAVSLVVAAPPVGIGVVLLLTTWTMEPAVLTIRLSALAVVFALVVSIRGRGDAEGSLIRRYAIVAPQVYLAAVVWASALDYALIDTRELEVERAVRDRWPDFPLWSDPSWTSNTSRLVTEWMEDGIRLLCFVPLLWWTRRYATARQASAWTWSSIAYAGVLYPVAAIVAWNFPGDEVRGDGFWAAPIVIGGGLVIGAFFVAVGTAISLALGRNPYSWLTGGPQPPSQPRSSRRWASS